MGVHHRFVMWLATLMVAAVLTACDEGLGTGEPAGGSSAAPTTTHPAATVTTRPEEPLERPFPEIVGNALPADLVLYAAGAVVRVEVVDVRGPFWNAADGEEWSERAFPASFTFPFQYREVDLEVGTIYRDEIGLGDVVTIVTCADACPLGTARQPPVIRLEVGDDVVVALVDSYFMMRERPVDRRYPLGGRSGVFDLARGAAWSRSTAEAVTLDDMATHLARLRAEDHSEWDYFRYPPTAAQELASLEAMFAEARERNRQTLLDLNNICDFVGDPERAQQWLDANPDQGITLEAMLDPIWFVDLCDGAEEIVREQR